MTVNSLEDTITAIATPPGTGGVGIIRISGGDSLNIISKIFSTKLKEKVLPEFTPNRVYHGRVFAEVNDDNYEGCAEAPAEGRLLNADNGLDSNFLKFNNIVDEVIILYFKSPSSYTGEDVVEIQCHGGIHIVKNILKLCIQAGARLAEKGEFTKRAFLNGKMDLSKAEAVLDLIHSKTDKFCSLSAHNLSGKLSNYIKELINELINLLSLITAAVDFPEEVDEPEYEYLKHRVNFVIEKINSVLNTAAGSNLMRQGMKVVIAGRPNAGKSSLFNALLDVERSIVTEIPGTTRDVIQETLDIGGIPVNLIDTAGIRQLNAESESNHIEKIGINIAKSYVESADVVLFVYDALQGLIEDDKIIYNEVKHKPLICIASKIDLLQNKESLKQSNILENSVLISSKTGDGIKEIKKELENIIFSNNNAGESEFLTNIRQQDCLVQAKNSLNHALDGINNKIVQDLISIDIKAALIALEEITGEAISDKIIDNIFSNFCIGK